VFVSSFATAGSLEQLPWATSPEQLLASLWIFDSGLVEMCASLHAISSSLIRLDIMVLYIQYSMPPMHAARPLALGGRNQRRTTPSLNDDTLAGASRTSIHE